MADLIYQVEVWADGVHYSVEVTACSDKDARERARRRVKYINPEAEEIKVTDCKQVGEQIPLFVDGPDDSDFCQ